MRRRKAKVGKAEKIQCLTSSVQRACCGIGVPVVFGKGREMWCLSGIWREAGYCHGSFGARGLRHVGSSDYGVVRDRRLQHKQKNGSGEGEAKQQDDHLNMAEGRCGLSANTVRATPRKAAAIAFPSTHFVAFRKRMLLPRFTTLQESHPPARPVPVRERVRPG